MSTIPTVYERNAAYVEGCLHPGTKAGAAIPLALRKGAWMQRSAAVEAGTRDQDAGWRKVYTWIDGESVCSGYSKGIRRALPITMDTFTRVEAIDAAAATAFGCPENTAGAFVIVVGDEEVGFAVETAAERDEWVASLNEAISLVDGPVPEAEGPGHTLFTLQDNRRELQARKTKFGSIGTGPQQEAVGDRAIAMCLAGNYIEKTASGYDDTIALASAPTSPAAPGGAEEPTPELTRRRSSLGGGRWHERFMWLAETKETVSYGKKPGHEDTVLPVADIADAYRLDPEDMDTLGAATKRLDQGFCIRLHSGRVLNMASKDLEAVTAWTVVLNFLRPESEEEAGRRLVVEGEVAGLETVQAGAWEDRFEALELEEKTRVIRDRLAAEHGHGAGQLDAARQQAVVAGYRDLTDGHQRILRTYELLEERKPVADQLEAQRLAELTAGHKDLQDGHQRIVATGQLLAMRKPGAEAIEDEEYAELMAGYRDLMAGHRAILLAQGSQQVAAPAPVVRQVAVVPDVEIESQEEAARTAIVDAEYAEVLGMYADLVEGHKEIMWNGQAPVHKKGGRQGKVANGSCCACA